MSNGVIAFMLAAGASTWVYSRFQRTSGSNTKQSIIGASIVAVIIFAISLVILRMAH